ncbi:hypothetical protein [Streptomyces sp. NRRL F-5135]|uniref:hypothetical protein n=1 Tax=Streptomyces sp. NRRL F-5135 TaxID=1463858 RepID=UPI0004C755F4|nr:hypothetical protein [Streptomyces sp. NRRL F-5135]
MHTRIRRPLLSVQTPGWSHPYPAGLFSPVFYADGDDGSDDKGGDGKPDKGSKDTKDDKSDTKPGTGESSEVEKWKNLARKHEQRAKENADAARERDELKAANATDTEKAISEAVKKAVAEERSRGASMLARQVFLAGAVGRLDNPADVVEDVNLAKYIDANGDVDEDGLAKLIDRLAPKKPDGGDGDGDGGQGETGGGDGRGDTRRRTRGGYQGSRQRGSGGRGGSLDEGRELYKQLLGGDKT